MSKKLVTTGLALGLVAGGAAGLALDIAGRAGASSPAVVATAAESGTTDTTPDAGATTDSQRPDPSTRLQEVLQPLIDNNTITQAQADAVIAALKDAMPDGPMGGGRGFGHHGGMRGVGGPSFDVVASTIGISIDDLRTALQGGQTIAQVAEANGKTADEVIAAVVADRTTKINQAVTDGRLTQTQADEMLANLQQRVTDFVNNAMPARGDHGPMGEPPADAGS